MIRSFDNIYLEISGACNAKCPWCVTGNKSGGRDHQIMNFTQFTRCLEALQKLELVSPQSLFNLYNWGEPSLNPTLTDMTELLATSGFHCGISTNCSRHFYLSTKGLRSLRYLTFSVAGMTDKSTLRIHGFAADKIQSNIVRLLADIRECGWTGHAQMAFHLYQFNLDEVPCAYDFCRKNNIHFIPQVAYFNDYEMALAYLKNTMKYEILSKASKELLLYYVPDLLQSMPPAYCCPQMGYLNINENCEVLTCCVLPKGHPDYSIGSIFDLSRDELLCKKMNRRECKTCIEVGVAYWAHHVQMPPFVRCMAGDHHYVTHLKSILRDILQPLAKRLLTLIH